MPRDAQAARKGDAPMVDTLSGRQLAEHHEAERRRMSVFSGALMTSGSFTMMASGSGFRRRMAETEPGRRRMNVFSGSLMTSGSFTMMASGTGF